MTLLYTARATVTGGRDGKAETDDGKLAITLSRPGGGGTGTNPEQLFAAGYAACFGGALSYVAGQRKLETGAITIHSEVTLNQNEQGFFIAAQLNVQMAGIDEKTGAVLVQDAHKVCPYSKATKGNITVTLKLNGKPVT
ncbi:MAG: Ohr family peroxiredoxin [Alphaproteobacteria bacterium]